LIHCAESIAKYVQHQFYSTILWEMVEHTSRWNMGQLAENMNHHQRSYDPPSPVPDGIDQGAVSDSDESFSFERTIRERQSALADPYETLDSENKATMSSCLPLPEPHPGARVQENDPYFAQGMRDGTYTVYVNMVEKTGDNSKVKSVMTTYSSQATLDVDPVPGEVIGVSNIQGGSAASSTGSNSLRSHWSGDSNDSCLNSDWPCSLQLPNSDR
jgi:hypothetical protein